MDGCVAAVAGDSCGQLSLLIERADLQSWTTMIQVEQFIPVLPLFIVVLVIKQLELKQRFIGWCSRVFQGMVFGIAD